VIDIVAVIGEFIGTTMFLFFAFAGTQLASLEVGDTSIEIEAGQAPGFNPGTLFYISASFGFSLMVNAWVFFRISGGLFNPAVKLPEPSFVYTSHTCRLHSPLHFLERSVPSELFFSLPLK
jgi:glycerol uptake facilitator-like aquaporin